MTFKYALVLPAAGANKIGRFKAWAKDNLSDIEVSLPPQVPVEGTALTVRLKSLEDRALLKSKFPATLP